MPPRAERRHHQRRMKVKAKRIVNDNGFPEYANECHKIANHLTVCSCYMCGNPRKHTGEVTMQERKAHELDTGNLMEPLGLEFEKVWDDNVHILYEE